MERIAELERTVDAATRPLRALDAVSARPRVPRGLYDAARTAHQAGAVLTEFESAIRPVIDTFARLGRIQEVTIPVAKATAGGVLVESRDVSLLVPQPSPATGTATTADGPTGRPGRSRLYDVHRPVIDIETARALVVAALEAYDDEWRVRFGADLGALVLTTALGFLFLPVGVAVGVLYVVVTTYGTAKL